MDITTFRRLLALTLLGACLAPQVITAQESKKKEEQNRNVMLNAASANGPREKTEIYLDKVLGKIVMDRTQSGIVDFGKLSEPHRIESHDNRKRTAINYVDDFALATWAPLSLATRADSYDLRIFVDKYTIELFVDDGRIAMTNQVFPRKPYNALTLSSDASASITDLAVYRLGL